MKIGEILLIIVATIITFLLMLFTIEAKADETTNWRDPKRCEFAYAPAVRNTVIQLRDQGITKETAFSIVFTLVEKELGTEIPKDLMEIIVHGTKFAYSYPYLNAFEIENLYLLVCQQRLQQVVSFNLGSV